MDTHTPNPAGTSSALEQHAEPGERDPASDRRTGYLLVLGMVAVVAVLEIAFGNVVPVVLMLMVIVIPMVFFHEWGHYITSKRFGIAVREFFVGFGPRLWSFRRGETEYGIKAFFPIGGYVKIAGMSQYEEERPEERGRTFRDAKPWHRAVVLVAGSVTHFFTAIVLTFVLLAFVGVPGDSEASTELRTIASGTPASEAGIEEGDVLLSVDGVPIGEWDDVARATDGKAGETVSVMVDRDGSTRSFTLTLDEHPDAATDPESEGRGYLGVGPVVILGEREKVSPGAAVPETFVFLGGFLSQAGQGIKDMVAPDNLRCLGEQLLRGDCETLDRPSSVVGIANAANQSRELGLDVFLMLLIAVNMFIGLFNLMPLPPLDGGHLAVLGYEQLATRIAGRPIEVDQAKLMPIAIGVMSLLLFLFLGAFYLDIVDPVQLGP